jgi:hypothetical protein
MGPRTIGFLAAAAALLAAAAPAAAQSRPDVSFSESSRGTGPTCVVGGAASDCGGGAAPFPGAIGVAAAPVVVAPSPGVGPVLGGVFGGPAGSDVGTTVDVDRSARQGSASAR